MTYILLKYEYNNELVIFWNFGIKKINFINFFIKLSLIFLIFNVLLNSLIVPYTQDKARSYIRSSDLDFFESILKPRKFIDVIDNLTIYLDEKAPNGDLKNIVLKDNTKNSGFQLTFAKKGQFQLKNGNKVLVLTDGKTLTKEKNSISGFEFKKSDFNINKFSSSTISNTKTQENSTKEILECLLKLYEIRNTEKNVMLPFGFVNCRIENLENIFQELYRRLILPLYCPVLFMISLCLILHSKENIIYNKLKLKVFIFGFLSIILLETSTKFISSNYMTNYFIFIIPLFIYLIMYLYFKRKLNLRKI